MELTKTLGYVAHISSLGQIYVYSEILHEAQNGPKSAKSFPL